LEFDMNTIETGPSDNARDSEMWSRSWTHFKVDRRSARYCHVTFDHPPINTITATTVAELNDLAGLIEQDPDLNVVVFDSANRDFYLAHYDFARTRELKGWVARIPSEALQGGAETS
jgi:enoyl-CoA hydratase/carnithine racemase